MSASTPVRDPDVRSQPLMTKRAWWLVGLNILIPGSAQVLAGDRRMGRFGLGATLVLWVIAAAAIALAVINRTLLVGLLTNSIVLIVLVVMLAFYAILWVVMTLNTLRLVRLVRVAPSARAFVGGLAVAALIVTSGGAGYAATNAVSAIGLLDTVFSGGQVAPPIDGRYNILLLGGDAGPDRMGLRPDSISVASIDAETGQTVILGIPRNMQRVPFAAGSPLWGPFPAGYDCGVDCLVSYLYTYGEEHPELYPDSLADGSEPGIEAMRDTAEGILGIQIQYFTLIDMQGFSALIDALGGVDITVDARLPIEGGQDSNGNPVNVSGWIEVGPQHMDGYTALWYARSRHSTNDYDRMSRQRDLQEAILKQMEPANVLAKFQGIAAAGSQVVRTDIPQPMLSHFVDLATKARDLSIVSYDFVPELWDTIHPDFAGIQAKTAELITLATAPSG